jgi:group I intron endonuclease
MRERAFLLTEIFELTKSSFPIISGIYEIRSLSNDKIYIGSSKNIFRRLRTHLKSLRKGSHQNKFLLSDFNNLGENTFEVSILEKIEDRIRLYEREFEFIVEKSSDNREKGYNIKRFGAVKSGWKHSESTKKRISETLKKRKGSYKLSDLHKKHISEFQSQPWNKKYKIETVEKLRKSRNKTLKERWGSKNDPGPLRIQMSRSYEDKYGKEKSDKIKSKMSESRKGLFQSDKKRELCRVSKLRDKNPMYIKIPRKIENEILRLFKKQINMTEIARIVGFSQYKIKRLLMENNLWKVKKR